MSKSENETAKAAMAYLLIKGWTVWRQNNLAVKGRTFLGKRGVSDLIALKPGGPAWFIECKNP